METSEPKSTYKYIIERVASLSVLTPSQLLLKVMGFEMLKI